MVDSVNMNNSALGTTKQQGDSVVYDYHLGEKVKVNLKPKPPLAEIAAPLLAKWGK